MNTRNTPALITADTMRRIACAAALSVAIFCCMLLATGCGGSGAAATAPPPTPEQLVFADRIIVNSTADLDTVPAGTMSLRVAIQQAGGTKRIVFHPSLNGGTIQLSTIADSHTLLKGEVYAGGPPVFQGYSDRDYGKSALYVRGNLTLDASDLPAGVTIKWTGGEANPARVLAVYGDLTLKNVRVTGGFSKAEAISDGTQPYTLARGGGLAVWGTATLENCAVFGNKISGDETSSRDRGAYGGGIYANGLVMKNCVVSGNTAIGYGAAGGGIYSVGGADKTTGVGNDAIIDQSTISGNRVTAQHAYGGGIFTLSGGPINLATMKVTNSTIACNLIEDHPGLPQQGQFYYRGGGIYMGGGSLTIVSSTIAENEVRGVAAVFSGKPNVGGGGIAATIGDAHVVENVELQHSIVVGNKLGDAPADIFAGSLLNFYSDGHNRIGAIDFSQILVPIPEWMNLSRKHYPKIGDRDGIVLSDVLGATDARYDSTIISAGTDAGQPALLWYPPKGDAIDQIASTNYSVVFVNLGYIGSGLPTDDFLNHALEKVRANYGETLGADFGSQFPDMTGVTFYGPSRTWPSNTANAAWIKFWRDLDTEIGARLGTEKLGDNFWATFTAGRLCENVNVTVSNQNYTVRPTTVDQRGKSRTPGLGDIGAIEY